MPAVLGLDRAAGLWPRLDRHLVTLADHTSRRGFLDRQLAGWEHRYARFLATDGASEPEAGDAADPPQASHFVRTPAGIAAPRGALGNGSALAPARLSVRQMPMRSVLSGKLDAVQGR